MLNEDKYFHPVPGVKYIKESVLGPGGDSDAYHSWFKMTCSCSEESPCMSDSHCECIQRYGNSYHNSLLITEKLNNEYCIYECSAFCSCGAHCSNKVVHKGPNPHLEIRKTVNKGLGVFSLKELEAGTFISEYAGELISKEVAEQRYKANENNKYILILREHYSGNVIQTCYDAHTSGNIARYINHSCLPNCVIIPVRTGCLVPKAALFSNRIIHKDEEITYSYYQGSFSLSNVKCFCESHNCKRFLPSNIDIL